jgi:hypothetical protein
VDIKDFRFENTPYFKNEEIKPLKPETEIKNFKNLDISAETYSRTDIKIETLKYAIKD